MRGDIALTARWDVKNLMFLSTISIPRALNLVMLRNVDWFYVKNNNNINALWNPLHICGSQKRWCYLERFRCTERERMQRRCTQFGLSLPMFLCRFWLFIFLLCFFYGFPVTKTALAEENEYKRLLKRSFKVASQIFQHCWWIQTWTYLDQLCCLACDI